MRNLIKIVILLFTTATFAQAGHLMAGVGSVNTSMGGAATAQPLDISGAIQWNPATISTFDSTILSLDVGLFFASPELSSYLPEGMMWPADAFGPGSPASPPVSGTTTDDKGVSPMPAIAMVWGKPDSKLTFGASAFGVSGFGVDFAEETNLPMDALGNPNPNWDPNNSNPISYPQTMNGFGHIKSNYMLMQIGFTVAYEISDKFSIGFTPNFNYASLEIAPNPTTAPDLPVEFGGGGKGYPESDVASTTGIGGQIGLFYDSGKGFKLGASYKTKQTLGDLKFENTYLDESSALDNQFDMDFPAILSFGVGYSNETFDLAVDYRFVDYENTDGFAEKGWVIAEEGMMAGFPTGAVKGFGWKNMNIISAGLQYKGINKLPLRVGYTYSSNPIDEELAFFSVSAPAIIENAFQFGLGYEINANFKLNAVYHHGSSGDKTEGEMLNPMMISEANPYGAMTGTKVGYEMSTDLIMIGISYTFKK